MRAARSNVSCLGGVDDFSLRSAERSLPRGDSAANFRVVRNVRRRSAEQRLSVAGSTLVDMAFATEHPVLAVSEHRPVGDIPRTSGRFEVVSDYQPSGDQPQAIAELRKRLDAGEGRRSARRHGHREVGDHRLADRAGAAADLVMPRTRPWPRSWRMSCDVPARRRRVLRLLLRLLPARGVRPADGHLHREGHLDQQRCRAVASLRDDVEPAVPSRRDRRRLGVVHLRPGHPQSYMDRSVALAVRSESPAGRPAAAARRHPVLAQ